MNFISSDKTKSFEGNTDAAHVEDLFLEDKIEPMSHIRKMISQHMIKSRDTSVHVYTSNEVDMTKIVNYRSIFGHQQQHLVSKK